MKPLPETEQSLVLRTDFSDDAAWQSLCAAIEAPVGDFRAYVEFVSDPAFDGLTLDQVLALHPQGAGRTFMFIVDQRAISDPEHPIRVVDLYEEPGRTFRVIPSAMWSVENNLSLANMDFFEFAEVVDSDGVFRGFGMF
ncbi:MAG TPA: hypothetical protein VHP83_04870 [Aggregatilineaceae bacterium]|nr:hypothetical protein [Aggregatilineaceae bacterium]